MNTTLRLIGIFTCLYFIYQAVIYGIEHHNAVLNTFFFWTGVVSFVLIISFAIIRAIYGPKWPLNLGSSVILGPELREVSRQIVTEFKQGKVQDITVTDFAAAVFKRLTRVGLIGLLIAAFPIFLLMQQNQLLRLQNDLFLRQDNLIEAQNNKIDAQLEMFDYQNQRINRQTELLDTQTNLFGLQNQLVVEQNQLINYQTELLRTQNNLFRIQNIKIDTQNNRLNMQNNLIEADRRSSLVLLMTNILDLIEREITEQKQRAEKVSLDSLNALQTKGFTLSYPLIGRIASLTEGFLPYRILQNDTLSTKEYSIERGQLLMVLVNSNLDSLSLRKIFKQANFTQSYLKGFNCSGANLSSANLERSNFTDAKLTNVNFRRANLAGANLHNANLSSSNLKRANLRMTIFTRADLSDADLSYTRLSGANLSRAKLVNTNLSMADLSDPHFRGWFNQENEIGNSDLSGANLYRANLDRALLIGAKLGRANLNAVTNLKIGQLLTCRSLFETEGLNKFEQQLQIQKPCLLTSKLCPL